MDDENLLFYSSKQLILDKNCLAVFQRQKPFPVFDTINFYFICLMCNNMGFFRTSETAYNTVIMVSFMLYDAIENFL